MFAAVLPEENITAAFTAARASWNGWLYSPAITVWVFLSQCLSADHSCRDAVGRLVAWLAAPWPTTVFAENRGLLHGPRQTAAGRLSSPAPRNRSPARAGRAGRVAVARAAGPGGRRDHADHARHRREPSRLPAAAVAAAGVRLPDRADGRALLVGRGHRVGGGLGQLHGQADRREQPAPRAARALEPGDVLLLDRYFSGWFDLALWASQGVDPVVRNHPLRTTDFRTGRRLGRGDHLVEWAKPQRPAWMTPTEYAALPAALTLREVRILVGQPGFRTRTIVVVTSLLDATEFTAAAIAQLYRRRWDAELHLRSLKIVLQMDHLRCQTPHRVGNEIDIHLTAYNLIRGLMAAAARAAGRPPWTVSFKGAVQTLNNLLPLVATLDAAAWSALLLHAVAAHTVGDRPDRYEPRVRKRRLKKYKLLREPRQNYRNRMAVKP